jgi:lysophospholipid acyltransferase (LPLAT)-like uncharacterized protein
MKARVTPGQLRVIARPLISALARTWRFEYPPQNPLETEVRAGRAAVVLACWHEELLPLLWHGRGFGMGVVVSSSRDGEYAAQVAEGFGYKPLRGSSSRKAARVLLEAVRELQAGTSVTFTPDGPRGPRRVFKPGAALAAQHAGVPLIPIRATPTRAWRLRSWDQFAIPKPGSRVRIAYGDPITVGPGSEGVSEAARVAEQALNLLGAAA